MGLKKGRCLVLWGFLFGFFHWFFMAGFLLADLELQAVSLPRFLAAPAIPKRKIKMQHMLYRLHCMELHFLQK